MLKVKDFIVKHQQSSFELMTPCGYISLTPKMAHELFIKENVSANPCCSGFDMMISSNEILNQNVCNSNFENGIWYLLTE